MNPLLQLYRYTPRLRNISLAHTASSCMYEECLLCQMGFLFDMLEKASGQNCQATNLLKTLATIPTASRVGILEEEPASSSTNNSLTSMMQSLNRFLLDTTINDIKTSQRPLGPDEAELPQALMIKAAKRQQCMVCHKESRPMGDSVTTDLVYTHKPPGNKALPSFAQTVRQSIQVETTTKGWCDKCRRYQTQHTRKSITKLPDILTFNCTIGDKAPLAGGGGAASQDYWSTAGWLPDEIGLTLNNKLLNVWQGEHLKRVAKRSNDQADLRIYELVGFVAEVREEEERRKHMVAFVNVALSRDGREDEDGDGDGGGEDDGSSDATSGADEPNWHVFNDFLVRPVTRDEALDFSPKWKMPAVLCYQLKSTRARRGVREEAAPTVWAPEEREARKLEQGNVAEKSAAALSVA